MDRTGTAWPGLADRADGFHRRFALSQALPVLLTLVLATALVFWAGTVPIV